MNDLQQLVSDRMAVLGLSYRAAAAKSEGQVSRATLNSIVSGRHAWRLDDRTITGIALALEVTDDKVRTAARQAARTEATEFALPERAAQLSARDRRAVLVMIDALLAAAEGARAEPTELRRRRTDRAG